MKKYNVQNYVRYKKDLKSSMPKDKFYDYYTRDEMIIKFMPLVENLARKFSTTQQASGVLSINDILQIGNEGLIKAVDKLDWELLTDSEDIEKTLKSFFSKRIKGNIRRRIDMMRGDMRIPEHKLNEIRKNPKDKKMVEIFFSTRNSKMMTFSNFSINLCPTPSLLSSMIGHPGTLTFYLSKMKKFLHFGMVIVIVVLFFHVNY